LEFTKMQGAGNDFIVVDEASFKGDWSRLAVCACDRHFGIGADGILVVGPSTVADLKMRIFNADGSEAATCGNGIRCVAKYYAESGRYQNESRRISVETRSGVRQTWIYRTNGNIRRVKVAMGRPGFGQAEYSDTINDLDTLDISKIVYKMKINNKDFVLDLVSIGNRHAVHFTDIPVCNFDLPEIGSLVGINFPEGINFEVARVIGGKGIEARVWEHGVGETLACGSGACAIGVAARIHGFITGNAEIELPGGVLLVEWEKDGEVLLTGPVQKVYKGEWPELALHKNIIKSIKRDKNEVLA
jgi:diaminopimelate epimerase